MVSVPKTDSPNTVHPDHSAVTGTSDTESNSGRDSEVSAFLRGVLVCSSGKRIFLNLFLHTIRMFSTLKQKWREDVYQVHHQRPFGLPHQNGSEYWFALSLSLSFCWTLDI